MSEKILVRIEYNEIEGDINFEQNLKSEQNDNDYKTIIDQVDSDTAFEFGNIIDEKYPNLGSGRKGESYPSFEEIKTDYWTFIVSKASDFR